MTYSSTFKTALAAHAFGKDVLAARAKRRPRACATTLGIVRQAHELASDEAIERAAHQELQTANHPLHERARLLALANQALREGNWSHRSLFGQEPITTMRQGVPLDRTDSHEMARMVLDDLHHLVDGSQPAFTSFHPQDTAAQPYKVSATTTLVGLTLTMDRAALERASDWVLGEMVTRLAAHGVRDSVFRVRLLVPRSVDPTRADALLGWNRNVLCQYDKLIDKDGQPSIQLIRQALDLPSTPNSPVTSTGTAVVSDAKTGESNETEGSEEGLGDPGEDGDHV